jgi:hypothetical protein
MRADVHFPDKHAEFGFGHVEPVAVPWSQWLANPSAPSIIENDGNF